MKCQLCTAIGLIPLVLGGSALAQTTSNPSNSPAGSPTASAPPAPAPAPASAPAPTPTAPAAVPPAQAAAPPAPAPSDTSTPAPSTAVQATTPVPAAATAEPPKPASQNSASDADASQTKPTKKKSASRGAESNAASISLSPTAPQVSTLPGSVTPGFEQAASVSPGDWKFDVHGLFVLPLAIGFNKRDSLTTPSDQKTTVLHSPPVTPEDREGFNWTGVTPQPWVQMNFSYGNRDVTANVILAVRTVTNANAYFNPPDYQGITDAFLTYRPPLARPINLTIDVGALTNRYGHMGEYDTGRYGQSLIARLSGVGTNVRAAIPAGDVQLLLETGVMGQVGKAPLGVEPAGWNNFADANLGSTYAVHGHVGARFAKKAELVGHAIYAFEQDDRANPTDQPDGSLTVLGVDGHVSAGHMGHLYLGLARTNATNARSISPVVRILEAPGGPGLMRSYFGPNGLGNGTLTTLGAQYDLSLGNLLSYPTPHDGNSPDVVLALFGIYTKVGSDQLGYDGVNKLKYGAEATYSITSWFAASGRYDRVMANTDDSRQTYAVISPRLIFHSDWDSQDQVVLQYSRYMVGSGVPVITGYPPAPDLYTVPDADVVSLTASMWW
jgi:hypothetical protein